MSIQRIRFKMNAEIKSISISEAKGQKKTAVPVATLKKDYGIVADAHAGSVRQVSLLAEESIEKMKAKGLKVGPGDFAENITTKGIDLLQIEIGTHIKIGNDVLLEITQHGKECHTRCNIYYQAGDCVMPKEGIFAKVLKGGVVRPGDQIKPQLTE